MIAWLLLLVTGAHAAAAHVVLAGETVETIALALGDPSLATAIRTDNDIAPGAQPAIGAILILPDAVPGISCEPSYVVHHVGPLFRRTAPDAASPTAFHYDPLGDLAPLSLGDTVCTGPVVATGDATDGYARLDLSVRPSDGTRDAITLLPGTCVTITAVDRVRDQRTSLVDLKQGAIIVEGGPQPGDVIVRTGGSSPDRSAVTVGHRGGFRVWAEPAAARTEAIGSDVSTTAQGVQVVLPEGFGGRTAYGEKPSDPHPLPPPPTLVRPDDGAVLLGPDFRWQPGGPAAQYVISFALPGDLSVPIQQDVVARPIFAPQWPETLALPAGDGVWSWQVMSVDAEGFQGKPSAFRAFRAPGSTPVITLLLMLLATAAEPTGAAAALAGDAPGLAGDGLQTAVFSSRGVVTDDTDTSRAGAATVHFGWAHLPFVLHGATDRVAVVRDDGVASVSGGVDFGPMRFAVAFPAYLATSDRFEGIRTAPGDASVEAHFVPFSAGGKHPGLGLIVHASFPLGAARLGLGGAGATWEGRVLLDGTAGPVWIAAEAGVRTVPTVTVGDVSVDTSFVFRQATGVRFSPHGGMTLEWFGAVGVLEPYAPESTPIEALLSGWIDVDHGLSIRLGAGTAVVRGWSAPPIRLLAEIHGEFPRVQRAKR